MIDPNRIANRANRNSSLNYDKLFPISKHSMPDTSLLPGCLPELMNRFAYHDRNAVNNLMERRDRIVRSFKTIFDQELQTKKYLMVGSGCPSIFDNGFTLMRNYGIPYIPASAFKGAFSHYVAQELEKDSLVKRNYRLLSDRGER